MLCLPITMEAANVGGEQDNLPGAGLKRCGTSEDEAAIDRMFHPEGRSHGLPDPGSDAWSGRKGSRNSIAHFVGAFPDIQVTIEDLIAEGDRVAIRWSAKMTHRGDELGFPATGRSATLEGASFVVMKDGKIYEGWNQMGMLELVQSLKAE